MNETTEGHRPQLLDALRRFVAAVRQIAGVRRVALLGSIVTAKPNPKDIDVLVIVADDADLTPLAALARRLQGQVQSFNRGADVFLADERGTYIGRTYHWRECRPGVRQFVRCPSLRSAAISPRRSRCHYVDQHRGAVAARHALAKVERRGELPKDVEEVVAAFEHAV
jgi:predicted nucleotidyltransferase